MKTAKFETTVKDKRETAAAASFEQASLKGWRSSLSWAALVSLALGLAAFCLLLFATAAGPEAGQTKGPPPLSSTLADPVAELQPGFRGPFLPPQGKSPLPLSSRRSQLSLRL